MSLKIWEYRETEIAAVRPAEPCTPPPAPIPLPGYTEEQLAARIQHALEEAEQRLAAAAEQKEARRREQLAATLQAFAGERTRYFRDAETEVVHLALAIARKILGREAALDPDLLAALVRIALDRMGAGPAVKLRVPPAELTQWQQQTFAGSPYHCELEADPSLAPGDCMVDTDLGTANFALDSQFKELEQGMLDLLRLRPLSQSHDATESTPGAAARSGEGT